VYHTNRCARISLRFEELVGSKDATLVLVHTHEAHQPKAFCDVVSGVASEHWNSVCHDGRDCGVDVIARNRDDEGVGRHLHICYGGNILGHLAGVEILIQAQIQMDAKITLCCLRCRFDRLPKEVSPSSVPDNFDAYVATIDAWVAGKVDTRGARWGAKEQRNGGPQLNRLDYKPRAAPGSLTVE